MSENLELNGITEPAYEAPERIARVVLASEAAGSSNEGDADYSSQRYYVLDQHEE